MGEQFQKSIAGRAVMGELWLWSCGCGAVAAVELWLWSCGCEVVAVELWL